MEGVVAADGENAFGNLPFCSCNVIAERGRLWQAMVPCLIMHCVCYAHMQYLIGCISWGFSGGVVAADGENAFANLPFC